MATSYSIAILRPGHPPAIERRSFADLPAGRPLGFAPRFPDGSIPDRDALLLVNRWNQQACEKAAAAGQPVRFAYFL